MHFELTLEGHLAVLEYKLKGNKYFIIHTGVPRELGGKGVAQALAIYALKYGGENGYETVIYCPYVKAFVQRHPDGRMSSRSHYDLEIYL